MSVRIRQTGDIGWMVLDPDEVFKGEVHFHEGRGEFAFVAGDTVLTESDLRDLYDFLVAKRLGKLNPDKRPHSRACGIAPHEHGNACSRNCPTCHGSDATTPANIVMRDATPDGVSE